MRIEVVNKIETGDGREAAVQELISAQFGPLIERIRVVDVYCIPDQLEPKAASIKTIFSDPIVQDWYIDQAAALAFGKDWNFAIETTFKAGVTDPVGITASEALWLEHGKEGHPPAFVQSGKQIVFYSRIDLRDEQLRDIAKLLHNPLIQRSEIRSYQDMASGNFFPALYKGVALGNVEDSLFIDIAQMNNDQLLSLSKDRLLALTLGEMIVIRNHFSDPKTQAIRAHAGLVSKISDVELEMLAQSWSEHCKHKIFAAEVDYRESENGKIQNIKSLFKTYIKDTTQELSAQRPDLRSVFYDNAGVVDFDDQHVVCFKVETHNSPSALDPYGGAITGIVGVNRDILGTGKGAKPIFNTNVLCFADPSTPDQDVPKGLLSPRRIMHGVHEGIIDGGNQSGIPTAAGGFIFDESYLGKPLVYCGTGGIMPREIGGEFSWIKHVLPGDLAVMLGGRIGKDGIHGATFSSLALDEESPSSAVQIGDPITQRRVRDFLLEARDLGLYRGITDNGAGGLSSSLGEMAQGSGGICIELEKAPVKYPGLSAWEIWVSESQERMSLAVDPALKEKFLLLARQRDVEATVIGSFTDSGFVDLKFNAKRVAYLSMDFVHEGLPAMKLQAVWQEDLQKRKSLGALSTKDSEHTKSLEALASALRNGVQTWQEVLGHINVRSREDLVRRYDHEVQAATKTKPYQGINQDAPSDGAVLRPVSGSQRGLSVTHGICPRVGDDDTAKMTLMAVDEAYRSHIALAGDPDKASLLDNFCWPDPVFGPDNSDGKYKMAQLVRANQALQAACRAYNLPLISGKDSMKNDARVGGKKISVRPTLLISLMGIVPDVRLTPASGFVSDGSIVYLLGPQSDALGGSVLEHQLQKQGTDHLGLAPDLDLIAAAKRYRRLADAIKKGLVESAHDVSDGGLVCALAEKALFANLGVDLNVDSLLYELETYYQGQNFSEEWLLACVLYGEGPSRLVLSLRPEAEAEFLAQFIGLEKSYLNRLGQVCSKNHVSISWNQTGAKNISLSLEQIRAAWKLDWK